MLPNWVDEAFLVPTGGVFHVLDVGGSHGRSLGSLVVHKYGGPIPEGAFYRYGDMLIESPAFMFLNAAAILDTPRLIAFGDELCGRYSFDAREERGFRKRKAPLTDKQVIGNFLLQAGGCWGHDKALRALPFVVEGSASPMETFDEMTMCLPYRYGGYGIYQPTMNLRVDLTPRAMRIAKQRKCYLDMGYEKAKLDVEHHGKLDHSSNEDKADDRARVNALKDMKFEVVELTAEQVGDLFAYECIIERIANRVGKRLCKNQLGATPERLALRKALYEWNRSSGRIR